MTVLPTTPKDSEFFYLASDFYKEAFGVRPSSQWLQDFNNSSEEEKQAIWDNLLAASKANAESRKYEQTKAIAEFEALVKETQHNCGNCSRANAIHYLMQAHELNSAVPFDVEHFEYILDVPFGYVWKYFDYPRIPKELL